MPVVDQRQRLVDEHGHCYPPSSRGPVLEPKRSPSTGWRVRTVSLRLVYLIFDRLLDWLTLLGRTSSPDMRASGVPGNHGNRPPVVIDCLT